MNIHDFDAYPNADAIGPLNSTSQRQRVAEAWVQQAIQDAPAHTVVSGLGVMGEVLACPSAPQIDHIAFCLLDCDDLVRLDRIRQRGDTENASMEMLCWAAWLRVHHVDPQFRQDVIMGEGHTDMAWARWQDWERGHPHWQSHYIDTTTMPLPDVAQGVAAWVRAEQQRYADGYRLEL